MYFISTALIIIYTIYLANLTTKKLFKKITCENKIKELENYKWHNIYIYIPLLF